MAARETRFEPKPGYTSAGKATLEVVKWEPVGNALDYKTTPVASYELFYRDGEVFLVKDGDECVYSELLDGEGGDDGEADVD